MVARGSFASLGRALDGDKLVEHVTVDMTGLDVDQHDFEKCSRMEKEWSQLGFNLV